MYTLRLQLLVLLLCAIATVPCRANLEHEQPIVLGDGQQIGPLAAEAISSEPFGCAYVYGSSQPDLFVGTGTAVNDGLFLYKWVGTDAETGAPIFDDRVEVSHPWDKNGTCEPGRIFDYDGTTYGVFVDGYDLVICTFDLDNLRFNQISSRSLSGLIPRTPRNVTVFINENDTFELIYAVGNGESSTPNDYDRWDGRYRMYDGAGISRGGFPYDYLFAMRLSELSDDGNLTNFRRATASDREVYYLIAGQGVANLGPGRERDIVGGSRAGEFHYYHNSAVGTGVTVSQKLLVANERGTALRHRNIRPTTITYPDPVTGLSNMIAGGEGMCSFLKFTGNFDSKGAPIYKDPTPVLIENADIYTGSLGVANVADWNGDGVDDLLVGNSDGFIEYFENTGTNTAPNFLTSQRIEAGGKLIHLQPGYWRDIQGPQESRWGYICPEVEDWNGDGLLDIIAGGSTAQYWVYINEGTPTEPKLKKGQVLRYEGIELHGTWRSKPGIATIGDRTAIVILDDQNEFHLYWRLDDYNVEDGGKLLLDDGRTITATPEERRSGAMGRVKINLEDWDSDGKLDLLVGSFGRTSIPDPYEGLPSSLLKKSSVIWLRNIGTDENMLFEFPKYIASDGVQIGHGGHSIGPDVCTFGAFGLKGLVVAVESGRVLFYHRANLSAESWSARPSDEGDNDD